MVSRLLTFGEHSLDWEDVFAHSPHPNPAMVFSGDMEPLSLAAGLLVFLFLNLTLPPFFFSALLPLQIFLVFPLPVTFFFFLMKACLLLS